MAAGTPIEPVDNAAGEAGGEAEDAPNIVMPELSRALSRRARSGKKWLLFWARLGLWALFFGALLSAANQVSHKLALGIEVPHVSIGGISVSFLAIATGFFYLLAGAMVVVRQIRQPEEAWYPSRATSEDIKSHSWLYAVGGDPYPILSQPETDPTARRRFREYLQRYIAMGMNEQTDPPLAADTADDITTSMAALRAAETKIRHKAYEKHRLRDQRDTYYARNARTYRRRARLWKALLFASFFLGLLVAGLQGFEVISFDLVGVTTTATGAITSWLLLAQYEALSKRYRGMVRLLDLFHSSWKDEHEVWTEEEWAEFVSKVEAALTAEHAEWGRLVRVGVNAADVFG